MKMQNCILKISIAALVGCARGNRERGGESEREGEKKRGHKRENMREKGIDEKMNNTKHQKKVYMKSKDDTGEKPISLSMYIITEMRKQINYDP